MKFSDEVIIDESGREWWTAKQAAEAFNVTVREIEERYKPLMTPGAVREPEKEYDYVYDFERPGYEFDEQAAREQIHKSAWKKSVEQESTDPFKRGFTINPDRVGGVPQDGDFDLWSTIETRGYDLGLEPVSRRLVNVTPRLFLRDELLNVRYEKVQSRKVKPLPPRGSGGRFAKS